VGLLEQHLGAGWEFETKVVFDAPYDEVVRHVRAPMGRLSRTGDGARCVLTGTTSNPAMYAGEWLAAIPHTFYVAGGPELRAAVADVKARLTAALGAPLGNERLQRARSPSGRQHADPQGLIMAKGALAELGILEHVAVRLPLLGAPPEDLGKLALALARAPVAAWQHRLTTPAAGTVAIHP
jgi:hypothetical protein